MATLLATLATAAGGAAAAGGVTTAASALAIGGTILSGVGGVVGGIAANKNAQYQAAQLEAQAKSEVALGQRDAANERKQKDLAISRAQAVGAASGGGVDIKAQSLIAEEGEYNALVAQWDAGERARGLRNQATATRQSGKNAAAAGWIKGGTTILDGGASFLEKFG